MGASRRLFAYAAPALLLFLTGCARPTEAEVEEAPPPSPPEAPAEVAADQLRPGELAEGEDEAFGLLLPRDMRVVRRFSESVVAMGSHPAESVANYVRERVHPATVEIGPRRTIFASSTVKGDSNGKILQIEVVRHPSKAEIIVTDKTPVPMEPGLTEAERWEKAGLSPSGKQLGLEELH